MGAWIEITYNTKSPFGNQFASGSARINESELAQWMQERLDGWPVIITSITVIKGELGKIV